MPMLDSTGAYSQIMPWDISKAAQVKRISPEKTCIHELQGQYSVFSFASGKSEIFFLPQRGQKRNLPG
jgi:hypothetical protein